MIKVCVLAPSALPIPAARGGAVETLIGNLLLQNEATPLFRFHVFSAYDTDAVSLAATYHNTSFTFVKVNRAIYTLSNIVYRVVKKYLKMSLPDHLLRYRMVRSLKCDDYDFILFEAGEVYCLRFYSRYLPKEKLLVHTHGMSVICPVSTNILRATYRWRLDAFVAS